ncbi:unnamed protein product [Brachionus calyciflorus]|uniref:Uncharacterized protein n=1 Tax=Brachionus calyciflorus TaxID=104777 RepID=A0A814MIV4_9BILA|nr:unnamed protein product [Brachionus calyciflorus]
MDNLEMFLPCGFLVSYKDLNNQTENFVCIICKDHILNKAECLNIKSNNLKIKEKKVEISCENLLNLSKQINLIIQDPTKAIKESFSSVKNQLDLKRETLKKQIDDHYFKLLNYLENIENNVIIDKNRALPVFSNFNCEPYKLDSSIDLNQKSSILDGFLKDLNEKIACLNESLYDLNIGENYKLKVAKNLPQIEDLLGTIEFDPLNNYEFKEVEERSKTFINGSLNLEDYKPISLSLSDIKFLDGEILVVQNGANTILKLDSNLRESKRYYGEKVNNLNIISKNLFSYNNERKIMIREVVTGAFYKVFEPEEDNINIICYKILTNGKVVGLFSDNSIKIWSLETCHLQKTYRLEFRIERNLTGHKNKVSCLLKINNNLLASGSDDFNIKIWNVKNGNILRTLEGHVGCVHCLDKMEDKFLVSCSKDCNVRIWDPIMGVCLLKVELPKMSYNLPGQISVNKDNKIAVGFNDKIKFIKILISKH